MSFLAAGFEFELGTLDGRRLAESVVPAKIDLAQLAFAATSHYSLWDTDEPTLALTDVRRLTELTPLARAVLAALLRRNQTRPNYLASAWVAGDNEYARRTIGAVLEEVGRDPSSIFATRDEALDYLQRFAAR